MRNKATTRGFYLKQLNFQEFGSADYDGYLMVQKDSIQIHFFEFTSLVSKENYGQVYIRTDKIDQLYRRFLDNKVDIHPNGALQNKPGSSRNSRYLTPTTIC